MFYRTHLEHNYLFSIDEALLLQPKEVFILHNAPTSFFKSSAPDVESSRTHFEVLRLEGQVLGLEASNPRKLPCPRFEDSTIFWVVKSLWSARKILWKTAFSGDRLKIFSEDLFSEIAWKNFLKIFYLESTCACVLGPWPWPRAFLSLASRGSVLGRVVLGLGFFCVLGLGLEPCVLNSTSAQPHRYSNLESNLEWVRVCQKALSYSKALKNTRETDWFRHYCIIFVVSKSQKIAVHPVGKASAAWSIGYWLTSCFLKKRTLIFNSGEAY